MSYLTYNRSWEYDRSALYQNSPLLVYQGGSFLLETLLSFVKQSFTLLINARVELLKISFRNGILDVLTTQKICKCPFCTSENRCNICEKKKIVTRTKTKRKIMKQTCNLIYMNVNFLHKLDLM